jgi:hypothetical protein
MARRFARWLALAALATLPALPAGARPAPAGEMAEKLGDPEIQRKLADAASAMGEALLDIPLEPFARAMRTVDPEAAADLPAGATLRDMAGPGADAVPAEMGRRLPRMMGAMAGMAGTMEAMLPELKRMAERMGREVLGEVRAGE